MAAQTGSVQIVHALLGAKAAVNQADRWDNTPLYAAARAGNIRAVQALLGAKATVNQAADDNMTALYTAAHAGRADIVRVLLLAKAATDQTDSRDRSPLYMAAQTKSIQTAQTDSIRAVQALLGAKAAVDQAADDGMTALSVAARRGCIETVRLLTDRKANIEPEADGTDYEAVAWVDPHQDVMQFPGDENEDSGSAEIRFANKPLWLAAMGGHASTVRLLLSKHADIECEDDRDSTALWAAAANQKTGVVSILVDAKASAGTANKGGVTPLQMAVMSGPGSKLTVKRLLAAKANPDASDDEDNTALSLCLEQTDNPSACLAIADLLVEHKAEVDPVSQTKISTLRAQAAPLAEGGEKKRTRLTTQYTGLR
jgi:ankyrin repeat protein